MHSKYVITVFVHKCNISRWCHGECDSIMTEEDAEKCHVAGYSCQLCRPAEALPPHLAMQTQEEREQATKPPSPPPSPEYPVYGGFYNNASYMLDGIMLSERGMQHLKSLTIEKDRVRRKRRLGPDMFNSLDPLGGSHDNSLEGDDDDEDDDKPMPSSVVQSHHKDGDVVRPLADGSAPDAPEGFTIVVKDNGLMVLRKKRYRDLKKVGIGGFLAKTRTPKTSNKKESPEEDKKKRPVWRPKKNKILVQYPEYIQDSFFGKDFMVKCPDKVDENYELPLADPKRVARQDEGTSLTLNRDALAALEEMKAKEEAEKKEKEQELADARAAAEAAANEAVDKARLAKEELDALKHGDIKDSKSFIKEDEKMDDEDLMLPSDLFGDDLFKLMNGGEIDIDESALDEAEEVNEEMDEVNPSTANNELEAGLRDMLGPDFDANDMEDILKGIVDNEEKAKIKTEIKMEPNDALPSSVNDTLNKLSENFDSFQSSSPGSAAIKEELISTSNQINQAATLAPSFIESSTNPSTPLDTQAQAPRQPEPQSQGMSPGLSIGAQNILRPPQPGHQNIIRGQLPGQQNMPGTQLQLGAQSMPQAHSPMQQQPMTMQNTLGSRVVVSSQQGFQTLEHQVIKRRHCFL